MNVRERKRQRKKGMKINKFIDSEREIQHKLLSDGDSFGAANFIYIYILYI